MAFRVFSRDKLMEASEEALTSAVGSGTRIASHAIAAERLLEDTRSFQAWESLHARLMQSVADRSSVGEQLFTLREQALTQIHKKALFEVMREGDWTHAERRYFFETLYDKRVDPYAAILNEHRSFIQAASSHCCLVSIGDRFMHDAVFDSWLADYADDYHRYIRYHVLSVLDAGGLRSDPTGELRGNEKAKLQQARQQILKIPRVPKLSRSGQPLRVATGDTQRLPRLTLSRSGKIALK
ncbi:MAG: hypothetical protein AAGH76_05340 [Pseudomonadota bacterium]